jgi:NAD(P)-dependent dehydrogenase (short-subunit alcohol dehydrogenase family)
MSEFEGKVAIVTGASSGIGKRTAEILASRGARVVVFSRSIEQLHAIAAPFGEAMRSVAGDVAELASIERAFAEAESHFGPCDVLINNAGVIDVSRVIDTTAEAWDRTFAVNVRGVFLACRRALPSMIQRKTGAIVNVASISGVLGPEKFPGTVSYCASKAAVISLTEALAVEVRDAGVRVNAVSPGSVDTPMWAGVSGGAPAAMTPDEVAETILFLASPRASAINGQNLHVFSS